MRILGAEALAAVFFGDADIEWRGERAETWDVLGAPPGRPYETKLLEDFRDNSGTNCASTFADSEAGSLFQSDRSTEGDYELHVVTGHNHFDLLRKLHRSRDVRRADVELGLVSLEERRVASSFL